MSGRGTTRAGLNSRLPSGAYDAPTPVALTSGGPIVEFIGEDLRSYEFDFRALPLPGWHHSLAAAWAVRTGPTGAIRTLASAKSAWGCLTRMLRYLATVPRPPESPGKLRIEHLDSYRRFRASLIGDEAAGVEMRTNALTFEIAPLREEVLVEVRDRMRPRVRSRRTPKPGYSDGELERLVEAARADVAALRNRLLSPTPSANADESEHLEEARRTGHVPLPGIGANLLPAARKRVAEKVFVTRDDVISMLVLLVAVTGWNVETIKELPVEYRVLEDRAVEVEITKRRRGPGRWHNTVTWEIGKPDEELRTPGGVYLLFHRLMAPARDLLTDPAYWAVWLNHGRDGGHDRVRSLFANTIGADLRMLPWSKAHSLTPDPPATASEAPTDPEGADSFLRLNFNRLKTSVDVRRTRQMGGHLPSSARSNTVPVLFRNYLSGDPTTIDWAQDVIAETLAEVENAAWAAHKAALAATGRTSVNVIPTVISAPEHGREPSLAPSSGAAAAEAAWSNCADHEHHPLTGRRCAASFLDCFHCGNCLVTGSHLPRLLALLDALQERRLQMQESAWWSKYGATWTAIRYDVLPKFSEAEVERARTMKPATSLLDLVEPRWEHP